jgi:hypothetical protein
MATYGEFANSPGMSRITQPGELTELVQYLDNRPSEVYKTTWHLNLALIALILSLTNVKTHNFWTVNFL